jgi:hypothetical protein
VVVVVVDVDVTTQGNTAPQPSQRVTALKMLLSVSATTMTVLVVVTPVDSVVDFAVVFATVLW